MRRSPVTVWAGQKGDHLEEMDKRNTVAHLFTKQARSALRCRPQDLKCTCPKGMIGEGQELVKPSARPRSLFKDNRKHWPSHLWLEGVPCVYQNGSCLCTVADWVQTVFGNFRDFQRDSDSIRHRYWGCQSWTPFSLHRCCISQLFPSSLCLFVSQSYFW